jgi:glutathione S-transferase
VFHAFLGYDRQVIRLYDLAGADPACRFSPYCWRTRLALAHKGLEVETIPWLFTEKEKIAFAGTQRVPVLADGERVVHDSWEIALYLEKAYPDRPSLFGGTAGIAPTRFLNSWADVVMIGAIARLIVSDIPSRLAEQDRAYFRKSREERYGTTLEALTANREKDVLTFRSVTLLPLRLTLQRQTFLGGDAPTYADYIVLGNFQWPRCISEFPLLERSDPIWAWRERMLDLFGGLGRNTPVAEAA